MANIDKINIDGTIYDIIDEKVKITSTNPASTTTYYPTWVDSSGTKGENINNGFAYLSGNGTTSQDGVAVVQAGNAIASGTANNKKGYFRVYNKNSNYATIGYNDSATSDAAHTLPATGGTIVNNNTFRSQATVTTTENGLMIAADKVKLDNLDNTKDVDKNVNSATKLTKTETVLQTNQVPYVSKASLSPEGFSGYIREKIVGGSISWNQKIPKTATTSTLQGITYTNNNDGSWTLTGTATSGNTFRNLQDTSVINYLPNHVYYVSAKSGHDKVGVAIMSQGMTGYVNKYVFNKESIVKLADFTVSGTTYGTWARLQVNQASGIDIGTCTYYPMVVDLTLMFGTAIADYIYSLETATAGAGVNYLKSLGLLTKPYYEYDGGSIQSVCVKEKKITGKNQLKPDTIVTYGGTVSYSIDNDGVITLNGTPTSTAFVGFQFRLKAGSYILNGCPSGGGTNTYRQDIRNSINGNIIQNIVDVGSGYSFTLTEDLSAYFVIRIAANYACNNLKFYPMIRYSDVTNSAYEPYHLDIIPLSATDLRGIVLKDASNNLYYDGDEYTSDGKITRKYGIVDLGTLTWTKASNNSRFYLTFSNAKAPSSNSVIANIVCSKYQSTTFSDNISPRDKTVAISTGKGLSIYDSAYSDATTFKSAMSGVYLVYELAEPTEETALVYQNPQYAKDGTEEFVDLNQHANDIAVPVGHVTEYMGATAGEYQVFPTMPVDDGTYLLTANKNNVTWERKNDWTLLSRYINTNVRIPVDIITNANELMLEVSIYSDYSTYSYSDVKILRIKDISSELTDTLLSFGYYHNDNDRVGAVFHMEINENTNSTISKESAWINNYDESTISFFISVYYR